MGSSMNDIGIVCHSGTWFSLLNPRSEDVYLEDIAHSLARQERFTGHCRTGSTVAEHSVRYARILRDEGRSRFVCAYGLLHDAVEAYIGDIGLPQKMLFVSMCPGFTEALDACEARIEKAIFTRFGLPLVHPACGKPIDLGLCSQEARIRLCGSRNRDFVLPYGDRWKWAAQEPRVEEYPQMAYEGWGFERAKREFLEEAGRLELV